MTYFPPFPDFARGPSNELIVGEKSLQHYQSPHFGANGESIFRDEVSETGSATVTVVNESEYKLSTTASGSDECYLESRQVCRTYPGQGAEIGVSVRSPDAFTGSQEVTFGLDDGENGVGFGRNASGFFTWTRNGGSITRVQSSSWNVDPMTGLGPSGLSLDPTTVTRFIVEYSSTFLGLINFYVIAWNTSTKEAEKILVHRWAPVSGALESIPFGPIRINLENGGTATARDFFVSELWFSTQGRQLPSRVTRECFSFRLGLTPGTTVIPAITWRRKAGAKFQRPRIAITGFEYIISGANMIITIREDHTTLTGAAYGGTQVSVNETSIEADISATATTGGTNRNQGFYTGAGVKDLIFPVDIPKYPKPIGVVMRTISGTATRVDLSLRGIEEW